MAVLLAAAGAECSSYGASPDGGSWFRQGGAHSRGHVSRRQRRAAAAAAASAAAKAATASGWPDHQPQAAAAQRSAGALSATAQAVGSQDSHCQQPQVAGLRQHPADTAEPATAAGASGGCSASDLAKAGQRQPQRCTVCATAAQPHAMTASCSGGGGGARPSAAGVSGMHPDVPAAALRSTPKSALTRQLSATALAAAAPADAAPQGSSPPASSAAPTRYC